MKRRDVFILAGGAVVSSVAPAAARVLAGPQPIASAPYNPERTLLLYCPEQGGWQTGEWCEGRWVSTADIAIVLEPTH